MSSPPRLPSHLDLLAKQLAELSVKDADVYANTKLLEDRVRQLRSALDKHLAAFLAGRNEDRQRKGSRAVPDDALLLFMQQLPLEDLVTAAQVSRKWRFVALSSPLLWTRLEARASVAVRTNAALQEDSDSELSDGDGLDEANVNADDCIVSNLRFLRKLLPRSQTQPLTLTVDVTEPECIAPKFIKKLQSFLELVAPRLETLHFHYSCLHLIKCVFDDDHAQWDFPLLRRLACDGPDYPEPVDDFEPFDLKRISCPGLAHLDLGAHFQIQNLRRQPRLEYLHTYVRRLEHTLAHRHATPALRSLAIGTGVSELMSTDYSRRADIFAVLNTLQEVRVRTDCRRDGPGLEAALELFQQHIRCKRLVLEVGYYQLEADFRVILRGRWVDATRIVLRGTQYGLDIIFTDDKRRTLSIRLLDAWRIDWACVPRLHALSRLRVDASVWCDVMRNFPSAPELANTTLVVDSARGLDAVMEAAARSSDPFWDSQRTAIAMGGGGRSGVENGLRDVPAVPDGSRLTLSSDKPVSITQWGLADVKKCLGAKQVAVDGVSMGRLRM